MRLHPRTLLPLLLFGAAMSSSGCTWVPLAPEAESVQVAPSQDAVTDCKKLGVVHSQTRARIGFFARSEEKISDELTALARNNAAEMGADSIVADGPPSVDGRQRFIAYRCR
jgi:DhnA family fructose-bisphosphate aldolase class Ia